MAVGESTSVNAPSISGKSEGEAREGREMSQESSRGGGDGEITAQVRPAAVCFSVAFCSLFRNHLPLTKMLWFRVCLAKQKSAGGDDETSWRRR